MRTALLFALFLAWTLPAAQAAPGKCANAVRKLVTQAIERSTDPFHQLPHEKSFVLRRTERPAGGSQGGEWFIDEDRKYYFAKDYGGDEERLIVEDLANRIYGEMGVQVPQTFLRKIDGHPYLLSREVPGRSVTSAGALSKTDAAEKFVVDAWLANWDVIGLDVDNVIVKDGKVTRVDNGGSLYYRAQGEKKAFGGTVEELETMRDPEFSSGQVFGKLSDAELAGQIRGFLERYASRRQSILGMVKGSGLPAAARAKVAAALDARAEWLAEKALPRFHQAAVARLGEGEALSQELHAVLGDAIWKQSLEQARRKLTPAARKLSDGELVALDVYTGGDFMEINASLRGKEENFGKWMPNARGRRLQAEAYRAYVEQARSALQKLPDFKGKVRRVVELDSRQLARYKVGDTVEEVAFTSTTHRGHAPYPGNVEFSILSKHGKKIAFINPNEDEVLFAPGARFKVTGKRFDKTEETWRIELIEVD